MQSDLHSANSEAGFVHSLRSTNTDLGGRGGTTNKLPCSYHKTSGRKCNKILGKRSAKLFTLRMYTIYKSFSLSIFSRGEG